MILYLKPTKKVKEPKSDLDRRTLESLSKGLFPNLLPGSYKELSRLEKSQNKISKLSKPNNQILAVVQRSFQTSTDHHYLRVKSSGESSRWNSSEITPNHARIYWHHMSKESLPTNRSLSSTLQDPIKGSRVLLRQMHS